MTGEERKGFLQFATGCSSLPPGGLANLHPRLTVVRKVDASDKVNTDGGYPSVNTCAHYLKLPDYSSGDIMRERLLAATNEKGFHLNWGDKKRMRSEIERLKECDKKCMGVLGVLIFRLVYVVRFFWSWSPISSFNVRLWLARKPVGWIRRRRRRWRKWRCCVTPKKCLTTQLYCFRRSSKAQTFNQDSLTDSISHFCVYHSHYLSLEFCSILFSFFAIITHVNKEENDC